MPRSAVGAANIQVGVQPAKLPPVAPHVTRVGQFRDLMRGVNCLSVFVPTAVVDLPAVVTQPP